MTHLQPEDFPLIANGQFVYARRGSSPIIGPVDFELAADLANRLNRDEAARATAAVPPRYEHVALLGRQTLAQPRP